MTTSLPALAKNLSNRIVEVARRDKDDSRMSRDRLLPALAGCHARGSTITVAWLRDRKGGAVRVYAEGVETAPGDGEQSFIRYPQGSRGWNIDPAEVSRQLESLSWTGVNLALAPSTVNVDSAADSLEEIFGTANRSIAGLVVVAKPTSHEAGNQIMERISDEIGRLEALRAGRGSHRQQVMHAEGNLEYLEQWIGAGLWELSVWAGGSGVTDATALVGMLAGSADVASAPILARGDAPSSSDTFEWSVGCVVGADAVAALARPPFREIPGVRVTPVPDFDQNVEDQIDLRLGNVLDASREAAAPFGVSLDSVNRHVFVSGATGSGKSETVRSLLLTLNQKSVPWLVIEPAKSEYAGIAPWLAANPSPVVIRPGDPDQPPPMLNPLEPSSIEAGGKTFTFPLQTHLDMIRALFTAAFDAEEPFPQVLGSALTRSYQRCGWNLVTTAASDRTLSAPTWPTLGDLVQESLAVVDGLGYGKEIRDNVRGFIRVRVDSLRSGTPGRFFEGGYALDLEDLLARPAIFEIEDLGDDRDKAFFIGNLIIRIVEHLRLKQKHGLLRPGLGHVLVIEEAHRLLHKVEEGSPASHAVTLFANLLAEIRAYGEGVVVAEQIPSKVIPDLVKNSAVKFMHRLPAQDDRDFVGSTMNLSEDQSAHVVALKPGHVVAHAAGMDRPVLASIAAVSTKKPTGTSVGKPKLASRSVSCGSNCDARKCSLGELENSRDLVTAEVQLWADVLTIAHLSGDPVGAPTGRWIEVLDAAGATRSTCAIGLAADAAVGRRRELVRLWYDPELLVVEVAEMMCAQLTSRRGIAHPRKKWRIGRFKYLDVRAELESGDASADRSTPHRKTAEWASAGITLGGHDWQEQLGELAALERSEPLVTRPALAGDLATLVALARQTGANGDDEAGLLAAAVARMGFRPDWIARRTGASRG